MPGSRCTSLNAYRQLVDVEKHDEPQHFAEALGAPCDLNGVEGKHALETIKPTAS